jgi:chemotaxis protein CheX
MTIALAPVLDTEAASPLHLKLLGAIGSGEPLMLDGSAVERVGLACLQVLVASEGAAKLVGLPFWLSDPSPALLEATRMTALDALLHG